MSLAQIALNNEGRIVQLMLPSEVTKGMGTMNPSIFMDGDKTYVNIRVLNYILYHNESQKYQHVYGPLQYIHPENDRTLTTYNYIAELDEDYNIKWFQPVNMLNLHQPIWEFVGLEDGRLFKANDKFYLAGVRRDTTTNGEGRMELSEISITPERVFEVSRQRIPAPGANNTYCEKNWMPVLGLDPITFVKWHHPTEVITFENGQTTQIALQDAPQFDIKADLRGGSHVVPYKDGYLGITHEVYLFKSELGSKNATYRHRFVYYNNNLQITKVSRDFSFMDADIEFCCGLAIKDDKIVISFGFQDNSAFILEMPERCLDAIA